MNNKDEALTYEELTSLCRKQEAYIKELEEKINSNVLIPKGTEKIEVYKPDYNELLIDNQYKSQKIYELEDTIQALLYSLRKTNIERLVNEDERRHFQEMYDRENKRANILSDELERAIPVDNKE